MIKISFQQTVRILVVALALSLAAYLGVKIYKWIEEYRITQKVIERLSADSRVAEVLVTQSRFDEATKKIETTIKFLEFDASGRPLAPKYFTFKGNVIQFQSLVIRFQDKFVRLGDKLKGKSAYLFLKAFMLDGQNTQEFAITEPNQIPEGYKIPNLRSKFESELWENFWIYALDPKAREHAGVKNAQIEAPGSIFVPGTIYTIHIEHDGGLRIDAKPIPEILKGELEKRDEVVKGDF